MPKSKTKNISEEEQISDDTESFQNSEDQYASSEELSGGASDADEKDELGDDSDNLDIDPDEDPNPDHGDKYDPINDNKEDEDPETLDDVEEEGDYEDKPESEHEDMEEGEAGDILDEVPEEEQITGDTKQCHLKNLNKDFIVLDEDDSNMYGKMEYKRIPDEQRQSDAIMTYYEMVRIIGTRAQQFNFGAEPLVKGLDGLHPAKKAYLELIAKMTPFIIRRHLPGKKYEEWRVDELDIIHTISDSFFVPENFDYDALMLQTNELNKPPESITTTQDTDKPSKRKHK